MCQIRKRNKSYWWCTRRRASRLSLEVKHSIDDIVRCLNHAHFILCGTWPTVQASKSLESPTKSTIFDRHCKTSERLCTLGDLKGTILESLEKRKSIWPNRHAFSLAQYLNKGNATQTIGIFKLYKALRTFSPPHSTMKGYRVCTHTTNFKILWKGTRTKNTCSRACSIGCVSVFTFFSFFMHTT